VSGYFFSDDKYVQMSLVLAAAPFEAGTVWGQINPYVTAQGLCQDDFPWGWQKGHSCFCASGAKATLLRF